MVRDLAQDLSGRTVVVTRARPGELDARLTQIGVAVVRAPVIAFRNPDDGGAALRAAVLDCAAGAYDWVVISSAVGVERFVEAVGELRTDDAKFAAVGPGTARALDNYGIAADLIPEVAVGEGLVDAFPVGCGRVLQIRPEVARDFLAEGIARKGWQVDEVVAYRTIAREVDALTKRAIQTADAVIFTSTSTVDNFIASVGLDGLPARTVSIGPITSQALRAHGIEPTIQASPHTIAGVVSALVALFRAR